MTTELLQLERIAKTMERIEALMLAEAERHQAFRRLGGSIKLAGNEGPELLSKIQDLTLQASLIRAEASEGLRSSQALSAKLFTGLDLCAEQPVAPAAPAAPFADPQALSSPRQVVVEALPLPTSSSSAPQADLGKTVD